MPKITLTNEDNMQLMARYPNNYFELAIVDPPYGIGEQGGVNRRGASKHSKKEWDNNPPLLSYFTEVNRVSQNQIIFGANYFIDKIERPSMGWICWDKKLDNSDFSDFELAYSSFDRAAKIFRLSKNGGSRTYAALKDIIHPTQKPVKLYKWLLKNYAQPGDKILDTHFGSLSIGIACHDMGYDLTACELDKYYFEAGKKRLELFQAALTIPYTDAK